MRISGRKVNRGGFLQAFCGSVTRLNIPAGKRMLCEHLGRQVVAVGVGGCLADWLIDWLVGWGLLVTTGTIGEVLKGLIRELVRRVGVLEAPRRGVEERGVSLYG